MAVRSFIRHLITSLTCGLIVWTCLALASTAAETKSVRNAEFAMAMTFPAADKICVALSGEHPHGFYAWYGTEETCHRSPSLSKVSAISIYASYNTAEWTSPRQELPSPCLKPASEALVSTAELNGLSFKHHRSIKCAIQQSDGSIAVHVVAFGRDMDEYSGLPRIVYHASLTTYPDRLHADLSMFKAFIASVKISKPE